MWLWLRRRFLTGFFVTVPLFISGYALVWIFRIVDGLTTPLYDRLIGRTVPGLGTRPTSDRVRQSLFDALHRAQMSVQLLKTADTLACPGTPRCPPSLSPPPIDSAWKPKKEIA